MKKSNLLLILVIFVVGCSSEVKLSKEDAKQQLLESIDKIELTTFSIGWYNEWKMSNEQPDKGVFLRKTWSKKGDMDYPYYYLEKNKLIIKEKMPSDSERYKIKLTEEGKKYLKKIYRSRGNIYAEVVAGKLENVEVLAITEPAPSNGVMVQTVKYKKIYKISPFGKIYTMGMEYEPSGYRQPIEIAKSNIHVAKFVKYDEGWKIEKLD